MKTPDEPPPPEDGFAPAPVAPVPPTPAPPAPPSLLVEELVPPAEHEINTNDAANQSERRMEHLFGTMKRDYERKFRKDTIGGRFATGS
jgi:hypothetical protein